MLIGIDASQAAKDKKTGVENFCFQLISHLLQCDDKNSYILYSDAPLASINSSKNVKILISKRKRFWHNLVLPRMINATKPDIFLSPGYMIPIVSNTKMISVIHDLAYKFFPGSYSRKERYLQKISLGRAAARASAIIFISQNTKKDFERFYPAFDKIKGVVYPGYDENLFSKSSDFRPTKEKYILSVGRLEERKNTKNLVKAFGILRSSHPDLKHKLVLAGKQGYRFNDIEREIKLLGKLSSEVIILGFVKDSDLPGLYQHADVYAYPSLYEGFGIPILEALASGTAVACSNTSSIPEAAGNAAILFNPLDAKDISDSIYSLLSNENLKKDLQNLAKQQLKKFNWENSSKQMIDYFERTYREK